MTTANDLRNSRTLAGARYAAALVELHESLIDLAALDAALSNRNISNSPVPTFGPLPADLRELYHPEFSPAPASVPRITDEIAAKRNVYVNAVAG